VCQEGRCRHTKGWAGGNKVLDKKHARVVGFFWIGQEGFFGDNTHADTARLHRERCDLGREKKS